VDPLSRRAFLKTIGQAGLICAAPGLARAVQSVDPDTVCISILHTTDLHGHILPTIDYDRNPDLGGFARCATQIRRWRRKNPNTILIDLGDVYQGTDVALRTRGALMIELFNYLKYDAWVVGNHEFDWGIETFSEALQRSTMPVLAANTLIEGKAAGEISGAQNPFGKIRPYILKEISGIKIAIVGVTTPGMPFWFRPEFTRGIEFQYPVEPVRRAMTKAKSEGADVIVLAGHMGLKARTGGDDFANTLMSITSEFPEVAVLIAGHTHQSIPSRSINNVLLTQADHFGVHIGRVDLIFDRNSKRLLSRQAQCALMDHSIPLDRRVLSRARSQLDESELALNQSIGELAETLHVRQHGGEPSDVERLIGASVMEALHDRGTLVDGAFHGIFDERDFKAGPKTVRDVWSVLPFENYIVTAELTPDEMKMMMEEVYLSRESRSLVGFDVATEGRGSERRITSLTHDDGRSLEGAKRYRIAFNMFDSRSGGHRFMKLRELLETSAANCTLHPVRTRDALIEYFQRHKVVHRILRPGRASIAA
jgi:2',3'-cyclic-nucleotide 2'-phosphodiesterase (5'-nucleotidase family)